MISECRLLNVTIKSKSLLRMRTTTWLTGLVAVGAHAGSSVTYVDLGLTGGTSEAKTEGEEASSADRRASARSAAAAATASTGCSYIKMRELEFGICCSD